MKRITVVSRLFVVSALGWCAACTQPGLCSTEAVAGIQVTTQDAISRMQLCDAMVVVRSGTYEETLQAFPGTPCSYAGAYERPGTYEVTVSRTGYRNATRRDIRVTQDECHVVTQEVPVELAPL